MALLSACALLSMAHGCGSTEGAPDGLPSADDAETEGGASFDAGIVDAPVGPLLISNLSGSPKSSPEVEPHIAQDGAGTLVAVWIAASSVLGKTIGYAVSHDRGDHWTAPVLIVAPGGRQSTDPAVTSDRSGNFYLSWYGSGSGVEDRIYVAKLAHATDVFGAPVEVSPSDPGYSVLDKPWLTADGRDEIVVAWIGSNADGSKSKLLTAKSRDSGATFQAVSVATDAPRRLPFLCVDRALGAAAPLYLINVLGPSTPEKIELRTSSDAVTWSSPSVIANDAVHQDPSCAVSGNRLWVSYAQGTLAASEAVTPEALSVRVLTSTNGGGSFSAAVPVNKGPAQAKYLLPDLTITPSGTLQVAYFQGVVDQAATLERALSIDGGTTWSNSTIAAAGSFVSDRQSLRRLGDYVGQASDAQFTYVVFGDNSGFCGSSQTIHCTHIAFARLPSN